jgi:predicted enzyme related to lactoylglutathione lyase
MPLQVNTLTVDSGDPRALAGFWSAALDWSIIQEGDEETLIAPARDRSELPGAIAVLFNRNADPKTVKNRWHFDLVPDDQETEVLRLEGLGARRVDIGQQDVGWVVMADPEGNEFCVLRSYQPQN